MITQNESRMTKQDDMNSLYVYIFFINLEVHRLSYLQNLNTFEYSVMPVLSGRSTHIHLAKPWLGGGGGIIFENEILSCKKD